MANDYIPRPDARLHAWQSNFSRRSTATRRTIVFGDEAIGGRAAHPSPARL